MPRESTARDSLLILLVLQERHNPLTVIHPIYIRLVISKLSSSSELESKSLTTSTWNMAVILVGKRLEF